MMMMTPTTQSRDTQRRPASGGFTLIELLLSIVIFAVVLTAINGVLFAALKLRNKTTQRLERALPFEHAAMIIRRDLEGLAPPGGAFAVAMKTGAVTGVNASDSGFEFYANTGVLTELQPWGDIQRIGYLLMESTNRLRTGSRSGKGLVRVVTRNLLSPTQETPDPEHLLEDVQSLTFEFYDGSQWKNTWDSTTETTIVPLAVRFSMTLSSTDEDETQSRPRPSAQQATVPFQILCPLLVTANTNQTSTTAQTPSGGGGGGGGGGQPGGGQPGGGRGGGS